MCCGTDLRENYHHDQAEEAAGKETRSLVGPKVACDAGLQMLPWRLGDVPLHGEVCGTVAGIISGVILTQERIFFAEGLGVCFFACCRQ